MQNLEVTKQGKTMVSDLTVSKTLIIYVFYSSKSKDKPLHDVVHKTINEMPYA